MGKALLLGIYPKEVKTYLHKHLHISVYISFIHTCLNFEASKMYFRKWVDKLWYNQIMDYYSVIKNELSNHEKVWKQLKCTLLSERSRHENAPYCMIPTTGHSRKGKTVETVKRPVVDNNWGLGGAAGMNKLGTDNFYSLWHYNNGYVINTFDQTHRMHNSKSEP